MKFGRTIPILRIFDEANAKEFYLGFLGFKVDWEHRFAPNLPLYMQVSRDECVLHLSAHQGDGSSGATIRVDTADVSELQAELAAKQYADGHLSIKSQSWGRDLSISDPFGNRLVFTTLNP